jgi:hypothetical protein
VSSCVPVPVPVPPPRLIPINNKAKATLYLEKYVPLRCLRSKVLIVNVGTSGTNAVAGRWRRRSSSRVTLGLLSFFTRWQLEGLKVHHLGGGGCWIGAGPVGELSGVRRPGLPFGLWRVRRPDHRSSNPTTPTYHQSLLASPKTACLSLSELHKLPDSLTRPELEGVRSPH